MDIMIEILLTALWLMLPAYIPNSTAAVFGGGRPLDGGKTLKDGRRILGDGKTFRGLIAGTVCGMLLGLLQMYYMSRQTTIFGMELPSFGAMPGALLVIFALAFGALLGDLSMSFFKRRLGLKRGAPLPGVDQLDFVLGAWVLTYIVAPSWFTANFTFYVALAVILVTPLLHVSTNIVGYLIGVKKEPW
jgi:CDP-2,3-bis-(O-geranylgeranyl)-sn-glycerol synthase